MRIVVGILAVALVATLADYTWYTLHVRHSIVRHPPRKAGGLMSWAASKAVGHWVWASRAARLIG